MSVSTAVCLVNVSQLCQYQLISGSAQCSSEVPSCRSVIYRCVRDYYKHGCYASVISMIR
jgi:hypothetical protein